jgi:hypothetical protein
MKTKCGGGCKHQAFISLCRNEMSLDQMLQSVWQLHGKRDGMRAISCCFA